MSARSYCFTSFLKEIKPKMDECRYIVLGREVCPTTGKEHIQGYAEFYNKITWRSAQRILGDPNCHIELRKGTREEARSYCMKDGVYEELGDWNAGGQGCRNDLKAIVEDIKNGKTDAEFLEESPEVIFKFHKFIQNARKILEEDKGNKYLKEFAKDFKPNETQNIIMKNLNECTERQVCWVHDPVGGQGKTWLSKYLLSQGAERFTNGKTADISYALKGKELIIFDLSRSLQDHVNYDIIEQIKNGLVFSGKYESQCKIFKPPKILILANFYPDTSKLSYDRWKIVSIEPPPAPHVPSGHGGCRGSPPSTG